MLWSAIREGGTSSDTFKRYVYGEISENYRRVFDASDKSLYAKCQLLCDVISGMTENHLMKKHEEFRSLQNV